MFKGEHVVGWEVTVERQIEGKDVREKILASWGVGWGGLQWIKELVEQGKATQHETYGYPNSYKALAKDILPLIKDRGSQKVYSMSRSVKIDYEKIKECSPDEELLIEAWDQS